MGSGVMLDKSPRAAQSSSKAVTDDAVFTFSDIFDFVRQNQRVLAISLAVPLVLAFWYLLSATPVYTARTQLLLDPQTPEPLAGTRAPGATFDSPQVESQIAVLRSEKIAMTVVKDLNLFNDPEFNQAVANLKEGETSPPPDTNQQQAVLYMVMKNLDARRSGASFAIDVMFTSEDPAKAARIANAFTQAFVQDQIATRADAIRAGSDWLEARIEQIRQTMNRAARRVQEFRVKRDYRITPRNGATPDDSARTTVGRSQTPAIPPTPPGATPSTIGQPAPPVPATPETVAPPVPADTGSKEQESLDELETTAQTYRKIYESYLQAYAESVQRQSFPVTNARVITLATPPLGKSHPKSSLILAFALVAGTLIGFGIALVKQNWRRN